MKHYRSTESLLNYKIPLHMRVHLLVVQRSGFFPMLSVHSRRFFSLHRPNAPDPVDFYHFSFQIAGKHPKEVSPEQEKKSKISTSSYYIIRSEERRVGKE